MIAFSIIKTIILLGLAGYQIIITILWLRASLVIYHIIQHALVVPKLSVLARVFDVEGGPIFSKYSKIV